jgi:excisionase family DNA binding protein
MADSFPLAVSLDSLRPLIREVVAAVLAEIGPTNDAPVLLTEAEAATRLGMSADTLRSERRLGRITCRQTGRKIRYSTEDLSRYVSRIKA